MKQIDIRISEIDNDGLLHQAVSTISYDEYKEFLILHKANILDDIINELEFKLNMLKNGNKED
jgi:hypothetical protein